MVDIEFEVQTKCGTRSDRFSGVKPSSKFPCFVLNHNDDWNDYSCYTWYSLFYFKSPEEKTFIGELKIMHKDNNDTNEVIPKNFKSLSPDYCSLGITTSYYQRLRNLFSADECDDILLALQDCAIQIERYDQYKEHSTYKNSLVRDMSSERAWRKAKYIIHNAPLSEAYSIKYLFHPRYNTEISVPFNLRYNSEAGSLDRCVGVIGENGVGKTTMLGGLIDTLINHKKENMNSEIPLFSCVMSVCTTPFDCFASIQQKKDTSSLMPYYYFCANQHKEEAFQKIKDSVVEIRHRTFDGTELFKFYEKIIVSGIPETSQYDWYYYEEKEENTLFHINDDSLRYMLDALSSGQLQLFMLLTFIFRKINYDALLVIDEPEVHLHPKAIKNLFRLLSYLLDRFKSYCIVSTHSPLIIRELVGRNVYIMRRQEDDLELGKIGFETLGEDISILYEEIFGYKEESTSLARFIKQLTREGRLYKDIVRIVGKGTKLSLNTRFLIKQIVDNEKDK